MTIEKSEAAVPDSLAAYRQSPAPSSALQRFNADGAAAMEIAINLAWTPFVPTSYKKGPNGAWLETREVAANVAAAWLAGEEIGLRPMQALQSLDIIEGKPSLNALAQRALVQSHGHEVWVHERTADARGQRTQVSVTVRGRRAGSEHVAESTWSLDRARQAGLLDKKNWQRHPEAMCFARASADVCRQIAADVLLGLGYTTEELEDEAATVDAGDHKVALRPAAEPEQKAVEAAPEQPTVEEIDAAGEQFVQPAEPEPEPEVDPNVCEQVKPDDPTRACSREKDHSGRHFYGRTIEAAPEPEPEPIQDPETTEPVLDPGLNDPEQADEEDTPFEEPTDEDLDRAYEEEQRQRAAAAANQPAADEAGDDDPWADFE